MQIILALGVTFLALSFGYLIISTVLGDRSFDVWDRIALSVGGLMTWVLFLMVLHIATRGALLSNPWLVRGLTALCALVLGVLRWRSGHRPSVASLRKSGAQVSIFIVLISIVTWCTPVLVGTPMPTSADMHLHVGWTEQLLNGESTPSATITGDVPNYYPWLYHSLAAVLQSFIPGDSAFLALGPIQLLLVIGVGVALFSLGRAFTGTLAGGATATFFGALLGEVSFPTPSVASTLLDPASPARRQALRSVADLAYHRSFNLPWHNLSPPYPRDLAFLLLAITLILLHRALRERSDPLLTATGLMLGLIGLAGGEAFFVGALVSAFACIVMAKLSPKTVLLRLALPALCIYALWIAPLISSYLDLGGFTNITDIGPVEWSLGHFLGAWGLVLIPGTIGLVRLLRSSGDKPHQRLPLAIVLVGAVVLAAASFLPVLLGTAFLSISRSHRYWPLLYLGMALCAAIALAPVITRGLRTHKRFVTSLTSIGLTAVVALGVTASFATAAPENRLHNARALELSLSGSEPTVLNELAARTGTCHVAAPETLSRLIFSYTGHRLVSWVGKSLARNSARIRWANIYSSIPDGLERHSANTQLTTGRVSQQRWTSLVSSYEVDVVVVKPYFADRPVFSDYPRRDVVWNERQDFVILDISDCNTD